jgi:ADP-heptose:LPS heptosyltransferase
LITPKPSNERQGVLILRLDVIGDFIMWLDSAKEFRKLFPNDNITLLGEKRWAEFAAQFPYWDDVWAFDSEMFFNNPLYRYHFMVKLIKSKFKTVIQVTHVRFLHGDAIVRASGADHRIGSIGDPRHKRRFQERHADAWYTTLIPASERPLMMLLREAEFIRGLGLRDYQAKLPDITPYLKPPTHAIDLPMEYCVLCPGAGGIYRRWPIEKFTQLVTRIYELTSLPLVVCGSHSEQSLAQVIVDTSKKSCINLAGQTSLNDLAWIIHNAAFAVANDTGAIHIAAAVGTPSVCIVGGRQYGRCLPYQVESGDTKFFPKVCIHKMDCFGCDWKKLCLPCENVKRGKCVPCIEHITVNDVFDEVNNIWQSLKKG